MFLAPLAKETRGFQKDSEGSSYLRHENGNRINPSEGIYDAAKLIRVDLHQPALRPEQKQTNN